MKAETIVRECRMHAGIVFDTWEKEIYGEMLHYPSEREGIVTVRARFFRRLVAPKSHAGKNHDGVSHEDIGEDSKNDRAVSARVAALRDSGNVAGADQRWIFYYGKRNATGIARVCAASVPNRGLSVDAGILVLRFGRWLLLGAGDVGGTTAAWFAVDARLLGLCERRVWME
jgi:hypothetical protein